MSGTVEITANDLRTRVERFQHVRTAIEAEVRKVIVGQEEVLEQLMIALFVGGHCLITGMPGVTSTSTVG